MNFPMAPGAKQDALEEFISNSLPRGHLRRDHEILGHGVRVVKVESFDGWAVIPTDMARAPEKVDGSLPELPSAF